MLYLVAIGRLPVSIGVLLEYTAALLLALWVRVVQRRPVKARLWVGLIAALTGLAGVAELIRVGPGARIGLATEVRLDAIGVAAALAAAVLLVVYYLLSARGVARRDPLSLTAYAYLTAAVCGALVRPWWNFDFGFFTRTAEHGLPVWALVTYIVIGGSIAPYLMFAMALKHLPATSVSIIGMLEPVFAAVVAWLAIGEHLNAGQVGGGLLILVGVGLAETARVRQSPAVRGEPAHSVQAEHQAERETRQEELEIAQVPPG
jgi:drug/metabolite transporter (DMT)-like permease